MTLRFIIISLSSLLGLANIISASFAASLVTASSSADIKVGDELDGSSSVALNAGEKVSVIDLETGTTSELRGPYLGSLADYVDPCIAKSKESSFCIDQTNSDVGATRGDIESDE